MPGKIVVKERKEQLWRSKGAKELVTNKKIFCHGCSRTCTPTRAYYRTVKKTNNTSFINASLRRNSRRYFDRSKLSSKCIELSNEALRELKWRLWELSYIHHVGNFFFFLEQD